MKKPLFLCLPALALGLLAAAVSSAAAEWRHGLSAFGDLALPPDFAHFAYVNPNAPKGGRITMTGTSEPTTFDSLNGYILKGDAAQGLEYLFDSLMTRNLDEPDAVYGLLARDAEVAADRKSVTFRLRPEARFADGSPVTADDAVFSFEALKQHGSPVYRVMLRDVVRAEAPDPATVRYTFQGDLVRDLPMTVAQLPVFSKAYYATRKFDETTLEPPPGSGPYKVGSFRAGTFITYVRRDGYWAKDLPVNRGRFNFGELRYEYFRNRSAELEALFSGILDFREEFVSQHWATAYPQLEGKLVRLTLRDDRPSGTQGFFLNARREKFQDVRVRRAFDLAFDFEWTNRNLFYSLYRRTTSFFENSDMKAAGLPGPDELALLEPFRASLPPAVFGEPYVPPVTDGSGRSRTHLREAQRLLAEAGWLEPGGRRLEAEFLIEEPSFERILGPYAANLQRIGVNATVRRVDAAQYQRRLKSFDFDIVTQRFVVGLTPGVELRNFFGSESAHTEGSFNLSGVAVPAVDTLIGHVVAANSRESLQAAARALDRVLRAGHYWVPQWYKASHNLAFWNKFGHPPAKPKYDPGVIETWWYDADKAAKLSAR